MGQIISVDATTGEFLLPCFEFQADAFETGLAFDTAGLEIQLMTNDGTLHRFVVGAKILNNTAPADITEISFFNPDGTNGWIVKLRVHLSVFSGLDIAAGESIGMIALKATGFAPVVGTLVFAKPIATDASGHVSLDVTDASLVEVLDRLGYLLARKAGAVADPQSETPEYVITRSGDTYTVTLAGVTLTGVRTAPSLVKT